MSTSMENNMIKALVVDDDLICLDVASKLFEKFNFKVVPFQSAAEALYSLKGNKGYEYGLALIEVHVGYTGFASMTGFDLLDHIQKEKKIPVFSMCAHKEDDELLVESLQNKVASFHISKPLTVERVHILHQKVMETKAKSSVGEASGSNDLASNEISSSRNVVPAGSVDVEKPDGRNQRRKRVCEYFEPVANKNLRTETPRKGSAAEDIIRRIVYQGQSNYQTSSHPQLTQQAEKNKGPMSFQGSKSNQSPLNYFQPIPHFHNLGFNRKSLPSPRAATTSRPSLSELLNGTNAAPRRVPMKPLYPFVGLCLQSNGKLLGLQWQNFGQANWLHLGEGFASLNKTSFDVTAGNVKGPGGIKGNTKGQCGDSLADLNWNQTDYHVVASENPTPDTPQVNNAGSYVLGGSRNEPEETEITDLLDVVEDFDIDKFDFDVSFMD